MATMNISLPDPLKEFAERQVSLGNFASSSDYVRDLIRRDRDSTTLRHLIVEGVASGTGSEMDAAYFDRLRELAHGAAEQPAS